MSAVDRARELLQGKPNAELVLAELERLVEVCQRGEINAATVFDVREHLVEALPGADPADIGAIARTLVTMAKQEGIRRIGAEVLAQLQRLRAVMMDGRNG